VILHRGNVNLGTSCANLDPGISSRCFSPILSPSSRTFVELTLVNWRQPWGSRVRDDWILSSGRDPSNFSLTRSANFAAANSSSSQIISSRLILSSKFRHRRVRSDRICPVDLLRMVSDKSSTSDTSSGYFSPSASSQLDPAIWKRLSRQIKVLTSKKQSSSATAWQSDQVPRRNRWVQSRTPTSQGRLMLLNVKARYKFKESTTSCAEGKMIKRRELFEFGHHKEIICPISLLIQLWWVPRKIRKGKSRAFGASSYIRIYTYVHLICGLWLSRKYIRQVTKLHGQLEEKYFDYNGVTPDCSDNSDKNILTTSSSRSSTAACHARGLVITHSCKLLATLGGSMSTRPWVRKITLKTCNFVDISNATIPTKARGLDNNFASDRGCDSTTTTHLPLYDRLRRTQ
jgi:hypothetical protein